MASAKTFFTYCLTACAFQGAGSSKPEGEILRVSLNPKSFQYTDNALKGATEEDKDKLLDYLADRRLLQKRSHALDVLGEKLQQENAGFASEADHVKFSLLQQQTLNFMDYLEEVNLLSIARDKLKAQKIEAANLLQSLGLDPASIDHLAATGSALAQEGGAILSDSRVLASAQRDHKTLLKYYEGHSSFKKASEALENQGGQLSRSVAEDRDLANETEDEQLDSLQKKTQELLGFFEKLKALRSARDELNSQKEDAANVLQSLGMSTRTIPASALAQLPDHVAFVTKTESQKFDTLQKGTANLVGAFEDLKELKLEHDRLNAQKLDAVKMLQSLGMSPQAVDSLQTSALAQVQSQSGASVKTATHAREADDKTSASQSEAEMFESLEKETATMLDSFQDLQVLKSKQDSLKALEKIATAKRVESSGRRRKSNARGFPGLIVSAIVTLLVGVLA